MKTPEQYFEEQDFDLGAEQADKDISPGEQLFIEKYLGGEGQKIKRVDQPEAASPGAKTEPAAKPSPEPSAASTVRTKASAPQQGKAPAGAQSSAWAGRERLKSREEIQLVSFFMGSQEFALPIETVKEVIKYIQPTRLPAAPSYLEGVINLRQRVTPIVCLAELMNPGGAKTREHRFIVVCRQDGLQVGLLVEKIATMYRMPGEDIEWNVESALGMSSSYVAALIKNRERIISILSIEAIVEHLLQD